MFNDVEIEVCDILLNLGSLIHQPETCPKIPFTWGLKKRRSTKTPPSLSSIPSISDFATTTTTSAANFQSEDYIIDDANDNKLDKVEASSPATPLSFSPSESDDKSKRSSLKKSLRKRTREEWLEIIEGLTQSREVLRGEVENVRNYCNKLKAFNMELKAMKHEILTNYLRQQQQFPNMEMKNASSSSSSQNLGIKMVQQHDGTIPLVMHHPNSNNYVVVPHCHATLTTITTTPLFSTSNVNNVVDGPCGIPDLNVSAEEEVFGVESSQPLDHHDSHGQSVERRKAAAAERRMIRRMIKKKKSEQHHRSR